MENKLKSLSCEKNPFLFDWLLTLNLNQLTNLKLDDNLEKELESYLQPGEKMGIIYSYSLFAGSSTIIKSTSELAPNEVNYIILLRRWQSVARKWLERRFSLIEMRQWMSWMTSVGFQSGELDSDLILALQTQGYTPHRLEAELVRMRKLLEGKIVARKEEGLFQILDVTWKTLLVRWKEINQQLINNWVAFSQLQTNQQLTESFNRTIDFQAAQIQLATSSSYY